MHMRLSRLAIMSRHLYIRAELFSFLMLMTPLPLVDELYVRALFRGKGLTSQANEFIVPRCMRNIRNRVDRLTTDDE